MRAADADKPALVGVEAEAMRKAAARQGKRPPRPKFSVEKENGKPAFGFPHSDMILGARWVGDVVATTSHDFMVRAISDLDWSGRERDTPRAHSAAGINALLAIVAAIEPENELEAALAIQMAGTHSLAAEMLGRARQTDRADHIQLYGSLAVKLQRTFTTQIEALAKLRNAGKQTVEVVHVHKQVYVGPGGQAIVGDVHNSPGGGGGDTAIAHQPHALSFAPGAPVPQVRSEDTGGLAMQVASDPREVAMSNAWGSQSRRAAG